MNHLEIIKNHFNLTQETADKIKIFQVKSLNLTLCKNIHIYSGHVKKTMKLSYSLPAQNDEKPNIRVGEKTNICINSIFTRCNNCESTGIANSKSIVLIPIMCQQCCGKGFYYTTIFSSVYKYSLTHYVISIDDKQVKDVNERELISRVQQVYNKKQHKRVDNDKLIRIHKTMSYSQVDIVYYKFPNMFGCNKTYLIAIAGNLVLFTKHPFSRCF